MRAKNCRAAGPTLPRAAIWVRGPATRRARPRAHVAPASRPAHKPKQKIASQTGFEPMILMIIMLTI